MIEKPENMNQVWAENGEVLNPNNLIPNKTSTGWTKEIPPLSFFNYIQKAVGGRSNYLNIVGVPEWDPLLTYSEGSWTRGASGVVYFSFTENNIGNAPESSPSFWSPISKDKNIGDGLLSYDTEQSLLSRGYLLQNGQAVSRTTYAQLFNLIGVRFGSGDGSTTFNLKNDLASEVSYVKAL